jgi:hypothetical protein
MHPIVSGCTQREQTAAVLNGYDVIPLTSLFGLRNVFLLPALDTHAGLLPFQHLSTRMVYCTVQFPDQ